MLYGILDGTMTTHGDTSRPLLKTGEDLRSGTWWAKVSRTSPGHGPRSSAGPCSSDVTG